MEDISDLVFNERWEDVLEAISGNKSVIANIDPYYIAYNLFYYSLVDNGKEEEISAFDNFEILKKVISVCKDNGMKGKTIPQATAFQDIIRINELIASGHRIDEEDF